MGVGGVVVGKGMAGRFGGLDRARGWRSRDELNL